MDKYQSEKTASVPSESITKVVEDIVGATIDSIGLATSIETAIYGTYPKNEPSNVMDKEPSLASLLHDQRERANQLHNMLVKIKNGI